MRSEDEIRKRIEKIKQRQESNQVTEYIPVQDVRNILICNFEWVLQFLMWLPWVVRLLRFSLRWAQQFPLAKKMPVLTV